MSELPRLLSAFRPLPGVIKADYEDFVVEELPLYPAAGAGTHTYFLLEKAGLATHQAVAEIARALGVARHDIGFAGLKDARAVTRQWLSVEHVEPERVAALGLSRLKILATTRHTNKLRLGHLQGNRFHIRVRQSDPDRLAELQDALAELGRHGVPNYFGSQRFGYRGDTWAVGRAIVAEDIDGAVDLMLGRPGPGDHGRVVQARQLYDQGDFEGAARAWPSLFRTERRMLRTLAREGGKRRRAFAAIDRTMRSFFVSAYQSELFNRVLSARLPGGLGTLWDGDLAWRHESGSVFRVPSAAAEQARADAGEISPTGPLFGYRMTQPEGEPWRVEEGVLSGEGLGPEAFHTPRLRVKGSRRPLRFLPTEARASLGADRRGPYLALEFVLPRGCYATAVLRELFLLQGSPAADAGEAESDLS